MVKITSQFAGKTYKEIAEIKAVEIAKVPLSGKYTQDEIEIEVLGIEKINLGVQIFARAWKNGKQIGFGGDGSVDIEKFQFFNTPIVVDDPLGDLSYTRKNTDDVLETVFMREDPLASIKYQLADTIRVLGKDGTRIIENKIGNTAATVYGVSGAMGNMQGPDNATYLTVRNAANATSVGTGSVDIQNEFYSPNYLIYRAAMVFDTSSIPSGSTINSAVMSIYPTGGTRSGAGYSGTIVSFTGSPTTIAVADYDNYGTTSGGAALESTLTAGAYRDITLNATGYTYLTLGGTSLLGLRSSGDINSTVPSGIDSRMSAQGTGGANPPKIVFDYTFSSFQASPMMHMMGSASGLV